VLVLLLLLLLLLLLHCHCCHSSPATAMPTLQLLLQSTAADQKVIVCCCELLCQKTPTQKCCVNVMFVSHSTHTSVQNRQLSHVLPTFRRHVADIPS
jgi:hypothetical protein